MPFSTSLNDTLMRVLAIICLLLSLREASVFLGIGSSQTSLIQNFGVLNFYLILGFTVFRLFASIGMWHKAMWGFVLALGVTIFEFSIIFFSIANIYISNIGLVIRIALFISIIALLTLNYITKRNAIYD